MRRVLKPGGTFAAVSHALPQARMDDDDEMSQGVDPTPWMSELNVYPRTEVQNK